ncbi:hypothetical protein ACQP3D_27570, partial [Escherichia coli]
WNVILAKEWCICLQQKVGNSYSALTALWGWFLTIYTHYALLKARCRGWRDVLPEDMSSIPSTHMVALNHL